MIGTGLVVGFGVLAAEYEPKSTVPKTQAIVASANNEPAKKAGLETVIIVYKTHFDIGYTTMAREVVHEYRTDMADRVLDAIKKNSQQPKEQQFVWTLSGWPMKQILWEGQPPERRQKIEQALRDGNLAVHAYPCTTHTETAELEDLVVTLPGDFKTATPVNLRGEKTGEPVRVNAGKLTFTLGAYAPASFLLIPSTTKEQHHATHHATPPDCRPRRADHRNNPLGR